MCNVVTNAMFSSDRMQARNDRLREQQRDEALMRQVDGTLEDSFPASDPPSWTASVARLAPAGPVARGRSVASPPHTTGVASI
jgi:hypothetical protein